MKKLIFVLFLFGVAYSANAQNFKTFEFIEREAKFVNTAYATDVFISPSFITLKKWNNGRKDDVVMKINKIENKLYFDKMCTWYFCTDTKKDDLDTDFRKNICIYNKNDKTLVFANFADEVTIFWYKLYLK